MFGSQRQPVPGQPRAWSLPWCRLILCAFIVAVTGCNSGPTLSQDEADKARTSLEKALNAWKSGEDEKKWSAKDPPVRFVDEDWKKGYKLIDYKIESLQANIDGYPEAIVEITVEAPKGGGQSTAKAKYNINVKKGTQVSIGRDPMF